MWRIKPLKSFTEYYFFNNTTHWKNNITGDRFNVFRDEKLKYTVDTTVLPSFPLQNTGFGDPNCL